MKRSIGCPALKYCEDKPMEIHPDFNELLKFFADFRVEYVIVGGYALAFHGAPRYTGDLDFLVATTPDNAGRIMNALHARRDARRTLLTSRL